MLRDEVRKNEEQEAANARERLVDSSDDKNNTKGENDKKNEEEKVVEEELTEKVLPEDDDSDGSEKVEQEIKEQKEDNQNQDRNPPNDDLQGSTVEIVQPADLKPKHLGFTRTLLLAMFAAMIGTGAQFGYALGVMNAPSEVKLFKDFFVQKMKFYFL
jgi:flagellar biosynthesis GTPase FlhF